MKDKVTRIQALTTYFENKKIQVRRDMHEFLSEYLRFPDGQHDDILDAMELACNDMITRNRQPRVITSAGGLFPAFKPAERYKWNHDGPKEGSVQANV